MLHCSILAFNFMPYTINSQSKSAVQIGSLSPLSQDNSTYSND